ncbi:hypothetical protein [Hymenobacter wooponensis]|uniref:Uncharacterized protein n=1 Tax=Hymenobacter wooponensis TaxID=1525360 RepID=A0A4Z0MSR2_9BACT|nr:hypothetical protein [Hymenobacter wooponensis]TGD82852.1 hypothetical protein EU557_03470 [Hymenobacter wooponensis]
MANQHTATPVPARELLMQMYHEQGLSQKEVGEALGVSQKVVFAWLKKLEIPARVAAKRNQRGEANHMWKAGDASYTAFHHRVESLRGKPMRCEVCGTEDESANYDWANLTGNYQDPQDYKRMCRSCHRQFDYAKDATPCE